MKDRAILNNAATQLEFDGHYELAAELRKVFEGLNKEVERISEEYSKLESVFNRANDEKQELQHLLETYRAALEDIAGRTASTIIESIAIDALEGNNLA